MTYDERPLSRKAIVIAGELALDDRGEAAGCIRDLIDLAKAYQRKAKALEDGLFPPRKALETIKRLEWRIG